MSINLNRIVSILYQYCFVILAIINVIAIFYAFQKSSFLIGVNFVNIINCVFTGHYLHQHGSNDNLINIFLVNICTMSTLNILFLIMLFLSYIFE